jgi:hypothetical protein
MSKVFDNSEDLRDVIGRGSGDDCGVDSLVDGATFNDVSMFDMSKSS